MDDLPTEIKEIIISFCSGESLFNLRLLNDEWKILVDSVDKRKYLFKRCLQREINKEELKDLVMKMYPKRKCLHIYPDLYKTIFVTHMKWKYLIDKEAFIKKVPISFHNIADLKTSADAVLVGDDHGFYIFNVFSKTPIFYRIGRVKNIEVYCNNSQIRNGNLWHDKADIMTENNIHHFYNFDKMGFEKHADVREKKDIKYWNEKSIKLAINRPHKNQFLKADFYENSLLIATDKNVILSKHPGRQNAIKIKFDAAGARSWCLWNAKLLICAKDDSMYISVDGKTRTIEYGDFPSITALFFYCGWLFLGSRYGSIYAYHLKVEDLMNLDLKKYDVKLDVCGSAIVKIDAVEKRKSFLIVASEKEIFLISFVAKS